MKIFILECTKDELRANRGIMDAIVDACQGVANTFFGMTTPSPARQDVESQENEDKE